MDKLSIKLKNILDKIRENSYLALDNQNCLIHTPSNKYLDYLYQKEFLLIQEEIGRKNKTILRKEAKGNPFLTNILKRGELK